MGLSSLYLACVASLYFSILAVLPLLRAVEGPGVLFYKENRIVLKLICTMNGVIDDELWIKVR